MNRDYLISNSTYDLLKRVVTLILPLLAALYAVLTDVRDLSYERAVLGTLAALAALGGVVMSISTKSWNESRSRYDGELTIVENDPDTGLPSLQLTITRDPVELAQKRTVYLRSNDRRPFV